MEQPTLQKLKITFWFDPDKRVAVADLFYNGKEHQTADIRDFHKCLVISKSTLVEGMNYKIVEDHHQEIGYTKKEVEVDVEIHTEPAIGYTYFYFDESVLKNIL